MSVMDRRWARYLIRLAIFVVSLTAAVLLTFGFVSVFSSGEQWGLMHSSFILFSPVLLDQPIEQRPRHMLQQPMEYAILMLHDVDPSGVPIRRQTLATQMNQRHAPCPQKLNRTAVGLTRR